LADSKFMPRCLNNKRQMAYSTLGFIIPCCWTDYPNTKDYKMFFEDSLHIDKNETIDDILKTDTWQKFYHMLENSPDAAPKHCITMCSNKTNPNKDKVIL
jgi:hypothetical protein